jgi:transketolase
MVGVALDAAEMLREQGIDARVLDMLSVKPIDRQAVLAAAQETGAIVTAEEHLVRGGMGAAIAQIVAEEHPVPMRFIGIRDAHMESGSVEELMVRHKFAAADIVNAALEAVAMKRKG